MFEPKTEVSYDILNRFFYYIKASAGKLFSGVIVLTALFLGCFFGGQNAAGAQQKYDKVLVISSYSYDWGSVPDQLEGIQEGIGKNVDIDYVFMDAKNRDEALAREELAQKLRQDKVFSKKGDAYRLVIASDEPALEFCQEYRDEFFAGLPIVFEGINDVESAKEIARDPMITGVTEQLPLYETISLATLLYPQAERVVAISNNTSTGTGSLRQFYACKKKCPNLKFADINTLNYSVEEIREMVSRYDEKTILLCLMFDRDKTGMKFEMKHGISWLYEVSNIPIFRADEIGIENGALGGCMISFKDMGCRAAKMARRILDGTDPAEIPIVEMPSFYEMNWKVMKRFGIGKDALNGETVKYREYVPGFWEKNRQELLVAAGIILFSGVIIITLLYENRKRHWLNKDLTEASRSMDAAIAIADLVFFEYYPELHLAVGLSQYDPFVPEKTLTNYPGDWIARNIVYPKDIERYKKLFKKIDSGENYAEAEVRLCHNGLFRWYQYRLKSIYDAEGKRIKVVGARMDISHIKEMEAGYQQHLNALFSANPNTIVSCHVNLTKKRILKLYTVKNGKMREMVQETSEIDELIRQMAATIRPKSDRKKFLETFSVAHLIEECNQGNKMISMTYRCMLEGELHWVTTMAEMVVEPNEGEIDAVFHAIDITYNRILELLLESAASHDYDSLSFVFGKSQRFASYSWLYPKEMIMKEHYSEALCEELLKCQIDDPEEIKKKVEWNTILDQLNQFGEYTVFVNQYQEDGERKRKKLQFFYVDEMEKLILASQRDVTDIYENEAKQKEALATALEQANAANRAKTDFLSRMSHDMRTPMNAIIGITTLAMDEADKEEAVVRNLTKIHSASHFLLSLINDILDMTKIEDGAIELHNEIYYYEDFLSDVKTMFEPLCRENGLQLLFECKEKENVPIVGDKVRIKQIFFNVLSNAVKFTPEGGKIIYREERFEVKGNCLYAAYSIVDTGIGMSREFQEKMFQPFVQEDSALTSKIQGTGLGLSITKSLIELMGGRIEIESELDVGTKVTLYFESRVAEEDFKKQLEQKETEPVEEYALVGKRVLLVEDHPLNTEIARRLLERKGVQVSCASNGKLGVKCFTASQEGEFDAVLMDIRMPIMNGLDAACAIRRLERSDAGTVPIIAMTANAYQEDIIMSKKAGMDAHLAKPIEPDVLYKTLVEKIYRGRESC